MMKETFSIKNKYKSSIFIGKITRVGLYDSIRINTCNDLIFPKLLKQNLMLIHLLKFSRSS